MLNVSALCFNAPLQKYSIISEAKMRSVCVFCGSHAGTDPRFKTLAIAAGQAIARSGMRLVYGGAEAGLMGGNGPGRLEGRRLGTGHYS